MLPSGNKHWYLIWNTPIAKWRWGGGASKQSVLCYVIKQIWAGQVCSLRLRAPPWAMRQQEQSKQPGEAGCWKGLRGCWVNPWRNRTQLQPTLPHSTCVTYHAFCNLRQAGVGNWLTAHRYGFNAFYHSPNDKSSTWLFHKALIEEICQNFIPEDTRVAISSSPASLELCPCTKVLISWDRNASTATSIKEANLCQSSQPRERSMPCSSIFYRLETTNLLLDYMLFLLQSSKSWWSSFTEDW